MKKIILILSVFAFLFSGDSYSQSHYRKTPPKRIIFQGNSLLDTNLGHTVNNQKYITLSIYNTLRPSYPGLSLFDFSISGQDQVQINALMTSQFNANTIGANDVVVIWEGTNNLSHYPSKTGAQAFAELQTWIAHVSQFTSKIIVCTTIARDLAGDPVDLMDRINDYNTLIRANYTGNQLCDLAADSHFDTRADASNTTYYDTDKLHQVAGGQNLVISLLTTSITNIL